MPKKDISIKGCYQLIIHLKRTRIFQVGKLGRFRFPVGYYVYTGSAQNGLSARLARHQRKEKKLHWHIDYLLQHARIVDTCIYSGTKSRECRLNKQVFKSETAQCIAPGFGSSDCRCETHLGYLGLKAPLL